MHLQLTVSAGDELRHRVRHRLKEGRLPPLVVDDLYAGYGRNQVCSACGEVITPEQVEYECTDPRDQSAIVLHLHCHRLWQSECASLTASASARSRWLAAPQE